MMAATHPDQPIQFRQHSFAAIVLAPEQPIADWLFQFDAWMQHSAGSLVGQPVVLELSALSLSKPDLAALIAALHKRDIRIIALEGMDPSSPGLGLWPVLSKGQQLRADETLDSHTLPVPPEPAFLLLDSTIRSGQSVIFPEGDVTVVGSVASGAEVAAGGSIHIYGALRGRAIAGSTGNPRARIFCHKFEAELLGIGGRYKAADQIEPHLHGRPVQAWLDRSAIMMAVLDAYEDSSEPRQLRRVTGWPRFWS